MTDLPPRLIDDPSFEAETGVRLREVDRAWSGYDLERIRARVKEPPRPAPRGPRWIAGGAAALLAGALLYGASGLIDLPAEPTPPLGAALQVDGPAAPPAEPTAELAATSPVVAPPPVVSPGRQERPVSQAVTPPDLHEPRVETATAVEAPVVIEAPVAPVAPVDELARETAALDAAEALLEAGSASNALSSYDSYLAAWPQGRLRAQAQLGRLESLAALGRWSDLDEASSRLADAAEMAGNGDRVDALRARALAELDRCDEALVVAAELARAELTALRKRCRR